MQVIDRVVMGLVGLVVTLVSWSFWATMIFFDMFDR